MPFHLLEGVKMKKTIIFLSLLLSSLVFAETNIDLNGYIRNETGVLLDTDKDSEFGLMKNTLNLELNYRNDDDTVGAKANPFIYYYGDNTYKMDLREIYFDIYLDSMDIRVGKQQIIWGKADGVFITDIVSPKDLTEFLTRDFEEIRIGVNSLKLDYYVGDATFELVVIPVFRPTILPADDSIWAPQKPDFLKHANIDMSKKDITPSITNSEVFFKYSLLASFMDFEVMAGYTWDDDPTLHMTQKIVNGMPQITITPEHHRLALMGGSFSKDMFGLFVLRSEIAFYYQKYFLLKTPDSVTHENTDQRDYIHYLVGVDATPFWDITMSIQFIQRAILNHDDNIKADEFDNTMTFLLRKTFLRETLTLEFFAYYGINTQDALLKPKMTYDFTDELKLTLGAYIFVGDDDGVFGQYKDNNMVYVKGKLNF